MLKRLRYIKCISLISAISLIMPFYAQAAEYTQEQLYIANIMVNEQGGNGRTDAEKLAHMKLVAEVMRNQMKEQRTVYKKTNLTWTDICFHRKLAFEGATDKFLCKNSNDLYNIGKKRIGDAQWEKVLQIAKSVTNGTFSENNAKGATAFHACGNQNCEKSTATLYVKNTNSGYTVFYKFKNIGGFVHNSANVQSCKKSNKTVVASTKVNSTGTSDPYKLGADPEPDETTAQAETKQPEKEVAFVESRGEYEYTGVYDKYQVIPDIMAVNCQMDAEDFLGDINYMYACINKYVTDMNTNSDSEISGTEAYEMLRYMAITDVLSVTFNRLADATVYEETVNNNEKAAAEGTTVRDSNAAMVNTNGILTGVINNMRELYAENLKLAAINGMPSINMKALQEVDLEEARNAQKDAYKAKRDKEKAQKQAEIDAKMHGYKDSLPSVVLVESQAQVVDSNQQSGTKQEDSTQSVSANSESEQASSDRNDETYKPSIANCHKYNECYNSCTVNVFVCQMKCDSECPDCGKICDNKSSFKFPELP